MSDNDEIIQEFISESRDLLEEVEPRLVGLKERMDNPEVDSGETINHIFRSFHSIKGSAGFLEFNYINCVTHEVETLFDLIRDKKLLITEAHIALLCRICDFLSDTLALIEEEGSDKSAEFAADEMIMTLRAVIHNDQDGGVATERSSAVRADEGFVAGDVKRSETLCPVIVEGVEQNRADKSAERDRDAETTDKHIMLSLITDEMRERFITEADDIVGNAENLLLKLEETAGPLSEIIAEVMRAIHSLKGNCGFMGYSDLGKISHSLETVLECIKEGGLGYTAVVENLCLKAIDILRSGIVDISNGGSGTILEWPSLCNQLDTLLPENAVPETCNEPMAGSEDLGTQSRRSPMNRPVSEKEGQPGSGNDMKPASSSSSVSAAEPSINSKRVVRRDIRVDLDKMDLLINLVGELVIAEAMVVHNPDLRGFEFENFERASAHMNRIIRDLQDVAMSVRMIPVSGTFRKMIRLVHDLSVKAGKKARLELEGEETEIDKTVAELIADPLVHIIRNAVDHGIDLPDERRKAGKDEAGTIRLEARHEGGEIWILIRDDGRGLNRAKIVSKGIERGLIKGNGSNMSDQEVFNLIFEPGFSTADKISDVSGRGVGMDVVRKNIEKLKGSIDIYSQAGQGSMFVLRIPLTLAIIEGMLIRVGHTRYTLPILAVRESIRVEKTQITTTMDSQVFIKVRHDLIPVVRLCDLHNIKPDFTELDEGIVVIIENQGSLVALFVDEVLGQHQAVIKGLSDYVGDVKSVSGCTILGDGDISLILDPGGVFQVARRIGESRAEAVMAGSAL
ncbi:MAG: chemotaxis protein CheA [Planctomycetota bacterium]